MFRILVAEDDKGTRRLMQDTLADAGYEPLPAADGQQALELLGQKHVDLMVLDVMMPKLDGFSLLSQLRSTGSDLPVLVLTAKEAQADKRRGLRLGADDYMTKPADEEELLLRIGALLRRAHTRTPLQVRAGARCFQILFRPAWDASLPPPERGTYRQVSGDNCGGVVITTWK